MSSFTQITPDEHRSAHPLLVSVIINNYNYADYLGQAIDSALQQHYSDIEILVVDDGSTDRSRDVIAEYSSKVTPIFKANGGQASALNAGFVASRGDIVMFLDADDILLPSAVANAAVEFGERGVSNVHWRMWVVDGQGNRSGNTKPPHPPGQGDFRDQLLERGPSNLPCSPTSGNAWSRTFLQCVLPIPEEIAYYRQCADEYLYSLAPAFGRLRTIVEPQSCYRIHGRNIYSALTFRDKLDLELSGYEQQCDAVRAALKRNGISIDANVWKPHSWFHRLERAVGDILDTVPNESSLVLVEGGAWDANGAFGRRSVRPFFEHKGDDWGPPPNSDAAIAQLDSFRQAGIDYLAIAWPSFWWYDEYPTFFDYLGNFAACVFRFDGVIIYKIASKTATLNYAPKHV